MRLVKYSFTNQFGDVNYFKKSEYDLYSDGLVLIYNFNTKDIKFKYYIDNNNGNVIKYYYSADNFYNKTYYSAVNIYKKYHL